MTPALFTTMSSRRAPYAAVDGAAGLLVGEVELEGEYAQAGTDGGLASQENRGC